MVKEKVERKNISKEDFKKKIIELAKTGLTSEKIGEKLRREGIHSKDHEIKISKVLKEENMYIIPEIKNVKEKLNKISEHYKKNKQDKRAKRETNRIYSRLRKLKIYHKIETR